MKIADTHAHIFPDKIAPAAVKATSRFYFDVPIYGSGTVEGLLEAGAKHGVERFMVFSTATTAHQVQSINNFIAAQCAAHPQFVGVGTMHVDFGDQAAEVERMRSLGLRGVKLHPDIQGFAMDDERLMPMYRALNDLDMFLISHNGDYRYDYSHPRRMARLAKMFPDMRFIGAHFGGWSQWQEARECLNLPNVYFDTSSTHATGGLEPIKKGFELFDNTHIFFASDYPMGDYGQEMNMLESLGLPDRVLEEIYWNNFDNLLK